MSYNLTFMGKICRVSFYGHLVTMKNICHFFLNMFKSFTKNKNLILFHTEIFVYQVIVKHASDLRQQRFQVQTESDTLRVHRF